MNDTGKKEFFLNSDGHLTDEGMALWVDAIVAGNLDIIPQSIKLHIDQCPECKARIVQVHEIITATDNKLPGGKSFTLFYKKPLRIYISIAALLIILIGISWLVFYLTKPEKDFESLFAEYFKPYPDVATMKNHTQDSGSDAFHIGLFYYNQRKYDSASIYFRMAGEQINNTPAKFYLAVSFLADTSSFQAIRILESLGSSENYFKDQALWYLALAYIKIQESEKANQVLNQIIEKKSPYLGKAVELQKKIDRFLEDGD